MPPASFGYLIVLQLLARRKLVDAEPLSLTPVFLSVRYTVPHRLVYRIVYRADGKQ